MKTLLSARQLFKELGLSYDQGLSEVRKGNLTMLKKPNGENLYADRSEVVRWRINRNREALGLAPIQPPTTAQELMVLDMLFMYKKDPDDEKYYMTDYERDWVAKKQEEANAKEEVVETEVSNEEVDTASQDVEVEVENTDEEEVEINQGQESEVSVDENNTEEDSEDVDDNESEASDSETKEDSEDDTNEAEEESVEESEKEEDEVDNSEQVDNDTNESELEDSNSEHE